MKRVEFSSDVRRLVVARNGYRCSFPECDQATLGPSSTETESVSTGVAAHIYSASPGGPRGQADLSSDELCGVSNAIWLCANHSRVIDANRGTDLSPALLRSYKSAHEALIGFEQRGAHDSLGWLQSLTVEESPVFARGSRVEFAQTTLISGDNASGKTALCEWLAGCTEISFPKRWAVDGKRAARTQVRFCAVHPLPLTWTIRIFDESNIQFDVNGSAVPRLNIHHKFLYLPTRPWRKSDETISGYLARWFRVDTGLIRNVVTSLAAHGGHHVNNPRFADNDGRDNLLVDVDGTTPGFGFDQLSDSEQQRVVLEFAIELAPHEAARSPTMLLIDCMGGFDQNYFADYVCLLTSQHFQAVAITTEENIDLRLTALTGLHIVTLQGCVTNVTIGP